jgi:hypothetical protein
MTDVTSGDRLLAAMKLQAARQVEHWALATEQLGDLGRHASPQSFAWLERYLGARIRDTLTNSVARLSRQTRALRAQADAAESRRDVARLRNDLLDFRRRYLAVETTMDFYADAINTRTNGVIGAQLRACDFLAGEAMRAVLQPLGRPVPPVLCYLDKGLGASILKAGLRLWDDSVSPVAAIKVVRHNLARPTALLHEVGHQIAHAVGWTSELATAIGAAMPDAELSSMWSGWASEIAADAVAFVHTGFASLAALHDVLAGEADWVMRILPGDPHPSGYVRVLLAREMCRQFYGKGPWDDLAEAWQATYPIARSMPEVARLLSRSVPLLRRIAMVVLEKKYRAFGGRALTDLVDPARVRPDALERLARDGGEALFSSSDWVRREGLRLLALTGYRAAIQPGEIATTLRQQETFMLRLGEHANAA